MNGSVSPEKFKAIVQSLNSYKSPMGIDTGGNVIFFHPNNKEAMRHMLELTEEQFNERAFYVIEGEA
jgi:hypothetical protein